MIRVELPSHLRTLAKVDDEVTLDIAERVRQLIVQRGFEAVMTRTVDETRSLMELRTVAEDGPLAPSRRSRRRQRHRVRGATSARSRSRCIPTNSSDTA